MIVQKIRLLILLLLGLSLSSPSHFVWAQAQTVSDSKTNLSVKDLPYCERVSRSTPPIWVTTTGFDTDKDRSYKNPQNYTQGLLGDKGTAPMIVPKRSIVRLDPKYAALVESKEDLEKNANKWLPVKVVAVPPENTKLKDAVSGNVAQVAKPKYQSTAKVGDEGRLRLGDLEKVTSQKDYSFIVKRDSPLYRAIHDSKNPNAPVNEVFSLELWQVNDKFQVRSCCETPWTKNSAGSLQPGQNCLDFPIFKAQGVKWKNGKDIIVQADCEECWLSSLVPMQNDFVKPLQSLLAHPSLGLDLGSPYSKLMSIGKLNFVDARGLVQIPVKDIEGDNIGQLGPYGSYRYVPNSNPVAKGNPDIYLRPETACGFIQALKTWNDKYCPNSKPSCRVEFGDASHALYEKFNSHNDHDNGDCLDIRPMGKSSDKPGGRNFLTSDFNRADFVKLMKIFNQLGPENCFIGDTQIASQFPACRYRSDHQDHLHICFPRHKINSKGESAPNLQLLKACQEGVQ